MDEDGYFGDAVAKSYDDDHGGGDPALIERTVKCLKGLTGTGSVLEFAVGTGRIALPLRASGVDVKGIELSKAMVAELRKKETGPPMDVTIGDMTSAQVPGQFSLVFLVFNTIDNLVTQEAQIACFKNAARHLDKGGRFLIETRVPPLQRIPFGETKMAFACSSDHFGVDDYDLVTQRYSSNHVWMKGDQHQHLSIPFRYVWPSELDLMAQLAGLELEYRWADWERSPFTHLSESHISVWRKSEG
ncbi:methyltransferase [Tateyamaria omphalii]|uniref:class I SAM-dependent DNA methyltransferase n=1 Tax=Tateyamaria omphalii TaxID=299262 RepID=UPI0016771144|nr:class I SAM-dependent methyltransferase [Tateyamaria omphalii]GGX53393.1 methyltransferase [Tateyamaria omphalii]